MILSLWKGSEAEADADVNLLCEVAATKEDVTIDDMVVFMLGLAYEITLNGVQMGVVISHCNRAIGVHLFPFNEDGG